MHVFGRENQFQIKYIPLLEKYKNDPVFLEKLERHKCYGEMEFIVKGKNLFDSQFVNNDMVQTFQGNLFQLIKFFCNNLYFHLIVDCFPTVTTSKIALEMSEEVSLVKQPDNDLSKYADIDFESLDMALLKKINCWDQRHCFIGNQGSSFLPYAFMRRVENNQIEISWDSTTSWSCDQGEFYFLHGKGVEYIDITLYKDTMVSFCLDAMERLGKYMMSYWIEEFYTNLQKAIDVKL